MEFHPNDWIWDQWGSDQYNLGSLHSTDGYGHIQVIHQRGIGFLANIDEKPRVRVQARSHNITKKED